MWFYKYILRKIFYKALDGHDTCFEVHSYLQSVCWILFVAVIMYFIGSIVVMKVCRNALYERCQKFSEKLGNLSCFLTKNL